jgi:hypothetical protein
MHHFLSYFVIFFPFAPTVPVTRAQASHTGQVVRIIECDYLPSRNLSSPELPGLQLSSQLHFRASAVSAALIVVVNGDTHVELESRGPEKLTFAREC